MGPELGPLSPLVPAFHSVLDFIYFNVLNIYGTDEGELFQLPMFIRATLTESCSTDIQAQCSDCVMFDNGPHMTQMTETL